MYGNILTQRFNFFSITPFRDYSNLKDKPHLSELNGEKFGEDDDLFLIKSNLSHMSNRLVDLMPKKHKKRTSVFFNSGTDDWVGVRVLPYSKTIYTTNVRHLKQHYNRPFSDVQTTIYERMITLTDDTLSVKFNSYVKFRGVNSKYFKKNSNTSGFKVNLKTGNIITYHSNGNKKHKSSKIRQNSFQNLIEVFVNLVNIDRAPFSKNGMDGMYDNYLTEMDNDVFLKTLYHTLCSLLDISDYSDKIGEKTTPETIIDLLGTLFIKIKNIKVPNNYTYYLHKWYPTQKYLKKNENKLIAAILDRLNLKTKSFIKLFHDHPNVNIGNLITLSKLFGYNDLHKYITNLDKRYYVGENLIKDTTNNIGRVFMNDQMSYQQLHDYYHYYLTNNEKSRLLKLLNSVFTSKEELIGRRTIEEQLRQIVDHVIMINKIREFIPTIEFKAQHIKDFHHEHIEYSKIERSIQKGYSIEYTFEQRLIDHIEEVIHSPAGFWSDHPGGESHYTPLAEQMFYPVILKTDGEYTEEGSHMHHCVASYADREMSLIVSIREGGIYGRERVTCEFNTRTKDLVQAKYFCNAAPPKNFEHAIEKIVHRINIFRGSIQSTGKRKIPLVIDGVTIPIKEVVDPFMMLLDQINEMR